MADHKLRTCLVPIAVLISGAFANAQERAPTYIEQAFADGEFRYAPPSPVQQAAYVGAPTPAYSAPPPAVTAVTTIIPPSNGAAIYPPVSSQVEVIPPSPSEAWCLPDGEPCRTSSWTLALETIITQANLSRFAFGSWPDEHAAAGRLILGYEDPTGLGIRGRFWGFEQDVSAFSTDVELSAGSASLDLYKRLFIDDFELVLGGGAVGGSLDFKIPDDGTWGFDGGGVNIFAEGFQPLLYFPKIVVGMVGRARLSLLEGDWDDTTTYIGLPSFGVPAVTDHDTMSIAELAWGLELRRRIGAHQDHHWFIAALVEHQRWESDWMATFAGTAVGFTGSNISLGITW